MSLVVVEPFWDPCDPFDRVAREIGQHQLQFFVEVIGLHRMHRHHHLRRGMHALPILGGTEIARVVFAARRVLFGNRRLPLPERHRAQAAIRRDQVHQMGRSGTREAQNDDRLADLLVVNLGVALKEVVDPQSIDGVAHAIVEMAKRPSFVRSSSSSISESQSSSRSTKSSGPKAARPV